MKRLIFLALLSATSLSAAPGPKFYTLAHPTPQTPTYTAPAIPPLFNATNLSNSLAANNQVLADVQAAYNALVQAFLVDDQLIFDQGQAILTLQAQVKALQGTTPPPPPPNTCPTGQLCIVTQPVSQTISLSAPLPGLLAGQAQFSTTVNATGCRTIIHTGAVNSYQPQQPTATWTYTTPVLTVAQSGTVYRLELYGCSGVTGDVISNPVTATVVP